MNFKRIDIDTWERREYFNHYIHEVNCSYSTTVNIDVTNLKGNKLYPTMIWFLTKAVNQTEQFRTALKGNCVGIYETMNPSFTIFNKDRKNFCSVWAEFSESYSQFCANYNEIVKNYKDSDVFMPQKIRPENTFDISMIPWFTFSSFNLNIKNDGKYLLPIFTMGKVFENNGKQMLPLAIQVHHAVCDGYHIGLFLEGLKSDIACFSKFCESK